MCFSLRLAPLVPGVPNKTRLESSIKKFKSMLFMIDFSVLGRGHVARGRHRGQLTNRDSVVLPAVMLWMR